MRKMIVSLGIKKGENNDNSGLLINRLQDSLLMIIVDTSEKYFSDVESKTDTRKVCISSVKLPSTLFLCLLLTTYNRLHHAQKQHLMLKSYIPGIYSLIGLKRHYYTFF